MTQTIFKLFESIPGVVLDAPGGIMTWQEWMTDSLALLPQPVTEGQPVQADLISFNNAQTLFSLTIPADAWQSICQSDCHIIATSALSEDGQIEGSLLKTEPLDRTGNFFLGIQKQIQGDCEGALACYSDALEKNPRLPRASNLQGLCYRLLKKTEESEKAYLREIEIYPEFPDAYCNLGILYQKTGRESMAKSMFEKSLDRNSLYWNALLQLSKYVFATSGPGDKLLPSLHHRLISCYHEFPQVQEHVTEVAAAKQVAFHEYLEHVRQGAGILSEPSLLTFLKRAEDLRLNGAYFSAMRGYSLLLDRIPSGTPLENYILHWIAKHVRHLAKIIPDSLKGVYQKLESQLLEKCPKLGKQDLTVAPPRITKDGKLTPEEFFSLFLEEVIKDGQIKPEEMQIVFRIKNSLRINEETHAKIFARVSKKLSGNQFADNSGDFSALQLYKRLHSAVVRDGIIDASEKKLLEIAHEAFDLLPDEIAQFPLEVNS